MREGKGGDAWVIGNRGMAIGGKGGNSGPGGKGGDGDSAEVMGDNAFAIGGDGGEAGQIDRGETERNLPCSNLKKWA